MYSSKENIAILTSLLAAYGVRDAVVCPGSRNAPIVHNLNACPAIRCYPVTDERSAAFFALGISQATDRPVVVCVTSGSAVLNTLPAVAEAYYQHRALIIVSADRPEAWIDQLDGQTIRQPGALGRWVRRSVSLPEPTDDVERWHTRRLVSECLLDACSAERCSVHINVPISEPLFDFSLPQLPEIQTLVRQDCRTDIRLPEQLLNDLAAAQRPVVVVGQLAPQELCGGDAEAAAAMLNGLASQVTLLHEALTPGNDTCPFDDVIAATGDALAPDFVLYVGGTIVSKRLKQLIRRAENVTVWRVNLTGEVEDTFLHLRGIAVASAGEALSALNSHLQHCPLPPSDYRSEWHSQLAAARERLDEAPTELSAAAAVRLFEKAIGSAEGIFVHYANSTAVRLANRYARHHVWCNRGVNGIEGSLSTAAGFSAAVEHPVYCVTGDLSFFYDQNALWNSNIRGNLRILLLNDGGGGIFDSLPGLDRSPAHRPLVAAAHSTTAQGICEECDVYYQKATDIESLRSGIALLTSSVFSRPMLLEVELG